MALTREKFYIIEPKAATNLVTNPSFETGTTGWTTAGAGVSIARVATKQRRGAYSLEIAPASDTWGGAGYSLSLTSGTQYTFSVDVLDISGLSFSLEVYEDGVGFKASIGWTGTGAWTRKSIMYTPTVTANHTFYVQRVSAADTRKFYIDGAQLEVGGESTYFDGDTEGFTTQRDYGWNGARHASTSYRLARTRSGGTLLDIENYAKILSHVGLGRAPDTAYASEINADGELYQDNKVLPRNFVLNLAFSGSTAEVVQARKTLLNALMLDKTPIRQPVLIRYQGVDDNGAWMTEPVDIVCVYRGGLERSADTYGIEKCAVQFRMYDPYFRMDGEVGQALGYSTSVSNFTRIGYRDTDGQWKAMGTGTNSYVRDLTVAPDGTLYAGGNFTSAGGVANTAYTARWNGTAWSALGTGTNAIVRALAVAPDGTLYVGGDFTTAGGVTANYIAKWNGSTWSALGTGMNSTVAVLAIAPDGTLYAGGTFTTAGGVTANRIAKWNGSTWSALGTGMNDSVYALAVAPDGTLYVGGAFTTAGGVTVNYVAKWNGTAWSALGTGMNSSVQTIAIAPDGTLYAGGAFTTAGGGTANYIAKWNGTAWSALGAGMNSTVLKLAVAPDGTLYAGGAFTTAGGISLPDCMAAWSGRRWMPMDVEVNDATANVYTMLALPDGRLYIGGAWSTTTATAATVTSANNAGVRAHPIIRVTGPGTVWQMKNYTNGDTVGFRDLNALSGELINVSARRGFHVSSSLRVSPALSANLTNYLLPGSTGFTLEPGNNNVSAYLTGGDANSAIIMTWRPTYASIEEALR